MWPTSQTMSLKHWNNEHPYFYSNLRLHKSIYIIRRYIKNRPHNSGQLVNKIPGFSTISINLCHLCYVHLLNIGNVKPPNSSFPLWFVSSFSSTNWRWKKKISVCQYINWTKKWFRKAVEQFEGIFLLIFLGYIVEF